MPQLPALQLEPRNALLDLTPVNNALMGIQRQQNANRDYAMQQDELAPRLQSLRESLGVQIGEQIRAQRGRFDAAYPFRGFCRPFGAHGFVRSFLLV